MQIKERTCHKVRRSRGKDVESKTFSCPSRGGRNGKPELSASASLLPSCGPSSGPSTYQDMYSFHNRCEQDQASWSRECSRSVLPGAAITIGRTCPGWSVGTASQSASAEAYGVAHCSQLPMSPITCPIPSPTVPVSCCCRYCYSILL
jgi:hypothetical protein